MIVQSTFRWLVPSARCFRVWSDIILTNALIDCCIWISLQTVFRKHGGHSSRPQGKVAANFRANHRHYTRLLVNKTLELCLVPEEHLFSAAFTECSLSHSCSDSAPTVGIPASLASAALSLSRTLTKHTTLSASKVAVPLRCFPQCIRLAFVLLRTVLTEAKVCRHDQLGISSCLPIAAFLQHWSRFIWAGQDAHG